MLWPVVQKAVHLIVEMIRYLWWLILCNFPALREVQRAGKSLFLSVSMKVFLDEISIWIGNYVKKVHSHQCGWAPSNLLGAWIEQKGAGRANSSLFLRWNIHLLLLNIRVLPKLRSGCSLLKSQYSRGKAVGKESLLHSRGWQGIFLTQGLNPRLLYWQVDSSPLNYHRSPIIKVSIS